MPSYALHSVSMAADTSCNKRITESERTRVRAFAHEPAEIIACCTRGPTDRQRGMFRKALDTKHDAALRSHSFASKIARSGLNGVQRDKFNR